MTEKHRRGNIPAILPKEFSVAVRVQAIADYHHTQVHAITDQRPGR